LIAPLPDIQNPVNLGSQLLQSLGVFRNPLKTSLLSAADVKSNPYAIWGMGPAARLINRLGGNFRRQHLPVPFEVYADGIDLVIFEEFGAGAAALHLQDEMQRNALMRDEEYRRRFRKEYESKSGIRVWHRDFFDAEIVDCPDASVIGKSFGAVAADRGGLHPVDAVLDRATPVSSWASPTPVRTFATWRSTTWVCGCCATCRTPRRQVSRS
jgi:N-acyl-D-aspartate/D-glutamate deacylase